MRILKTNTTVRIVVGPFLDAADGVTPETSLTVTNDTCELYHEHDDGSAPTRAALTLSASGGNNDMIHIASDVGGFYDLELTASDLNWLGRGKLSIVDTDVHLPVFEDLIVLPANLFDALMGTDYLKTDVMQIEGADATDSLATAAQIATAVAAQTDIAALLAAWADGGRLDLLLDKVPKSDGTVSLNATVLAAIADAAHDEVIEGTLTQRQITRIILSVLAGLTTTGGTRFRDLANAKDRVIAVIDGSGNRTTMTKDGT